MSWKNQLKKLENKKEWDAAIQYIQNIIVENPNDLDAYLSINYLLMNLLVEEDYDRIKHDYYAALTKKYFDESYAKFSNNPEYLFYIARIAVMSEWYFGLEMKDAEEMLQKSMLLAPQNVLYKFTYYGDLKKQNLENRSEIIYYAQLILQPQSPIKTILETKGSLGEYLLDIMMNWSKNSLSFFGVCD